MVQIFPRHASCECLNMHNTGRLGGVIAQMEEMQNKNCVSISCERHLSMRRSAHRSLQFLTPREEAFIRRASNGPDLISLIFPALLGTTGFRSCLCLGHLFLGFDKNST